MFCHPDVFSHEEAFFLLVLSECNFNVTNYFKHFSYRILFFLNCFPLKDDLDVYTYFVSSQCVKINIKDKQVKYFIHYSGWNKK